MTQPPRFQLCKIEKKWVEKVKEMASFREEVERYDALGESVTFIDFMKKYGEEKGIFGFLRRMFETFGGENRLSPYSFYNKMKQGQYHFAEGWYQTFKAHYQQEKKLQDYVVANYSSEQLNWNQMWFFREIENPRFDKTKILFLDLSHNHLDHDFLSQLETALECDHLMLDLSENDDLKWEYVLDFVVGWKGKIQVYFPSEASDSRIITDESKWNEMTKVVKQYHVSYHKDCAPIVKRLSVFDSKKSMARLGQCLVDGTCCKRDLIGGYKSYLKSGEQDDEFEEETSEIYKNLVFHDIREEEMWVDM